MNNVYLSKYNELNFALSDAFLKLLSQNEYKCAVKLLIGNQISVEELGLQQKTVDFLVSKGIPTLCILIDRYDFVFFSDEISHQLETYIRNLISTIIPKQVEHCQQESVLKSKENPDERFFKYENIDHFIEYFANHDVTIAALHLSVRSQNALRRSGIQTLSELLECSIKEIEGCRNLGRKSIEEIRETVTEFLNSVTEKASDIPETEQTSDTFLSMEISSDSYDTGIWGSELFANEMNRNRIIHYFENKRINLAESLLSVRAKNILTREFGTDTPYFSDLLYLYPKDLSSIRNLGEKTKFEIVQFVIGILDRYSSEIRRCLTEENTVPYTEEEVQHMLLSLYKSKTDFYGCSFKEFREELPSSITDDDIRAGVSALLRDGKLEYADFRCYRVYPQFTDYCMSCSELNEKMKTILLGRMQGMHLNEIGDQMGGLSRERIRQIESKAIKIVNRFHSKQLFDEDYYRYLFENYCIPKEAWLYYLQCSEETLWYLSTFCRTEEKFAEDALDDPHVSINLKYRLQKYFESKMLYVQDGFVSRDRVSFERSVLSHFCRDEIAFDAYTEIFNAILRENRVAENDSLYYTVDNKKSRANRLASSSPYILWKQGGKLRYYDTSAQDFTELLDTLNLGQYSNIELSADKFMADYPMLMKK